MASPAQLPARPRWTGSPALLLSAGAALVVMSQLRWGIGALAWLAPVPLLRYLRITRGWRARTLLAVVLLGAWIAAALKITTAPLPLAFALPVGGGLGVAAAAVYLGWDLLRRRAPAWAATLAFPAWAAVVEWLQPRATPLATWGAAAYTQVENLPLLQLASVLGMAGVGFLVHWVAAWLESALSSALDGGPAPWRHGIAVGAALSAAVTFGSLRLAEPLPADSVRVAAIGTTATFTGFPVPSRAERDRIVDTLLADTRRAAEGGARIAVWTEASAVVEPGAEEDALVARGLETARRLGIEIVMAYIVPRSVQPPSFENKYAWASPAGLRQAYEKHHPAPGEPAIVGTGPLSAVEVPWGRAGGALCYDYDHPALAREHARLGVGLVALPSSDWRGIDPIHTQMAAVRAIEGGFSLLRSTRSGLSGAIDARGRFRAWQSSFDPGDRVVLADLPAVAVPTAYAAAGDVLVWIAMAGLAALALRAVLHRSTRAVPSPGAAGVASSAPEAAR